ncbi:MAG: DUF6414 family protein [Microthrixaceae bacterium]
MSIRSKVRGWRRRRRRKKAAEESAGTPLREFVYLDDVSVYSLTASRLGAIATEFTDTETNTLGGEVESSIEGFGGFAKGGVRAKSSASREQSSQVVRKSIIQTAFKDLYELEADRLLIGGPSAQLPDQLASADLTRLADQGEWVIDPAKFERGGLIELEVELETEAVFRVNAVVSAFLEIVQEDLEVFGITGPVGIAEARAMSRVLDKLLTGLVPLRGRAVDFVRTSVNGRDLVVHREVLDRLPESSRPAVEPLLVVGVAEQRLFWKDIRRVLFSNSRFRMFCRVSQSGLRDRWAPVKLTEVLKEIAPEFEAQILGALGESALSAMGDAIARGSSSDEVERDYLELAAGSFLAAVSDHHGRTLEPARLRALGVEAADSGGSLATTDDRRAFYGALLDQLDSELAVETPPEVAETCRVIATSEAGLGLGGSLAPRRASEVPPSAMAQTRFLDTEIVAIYW